MIRLLRSMLRVRPGAAFTVLILSAIASAAAVAGPLYLSGAEPAATSAEVSAASGAQRAILRTGIIDTTRGFRRERDMTGLRPLLPYRDGFQTVSGLLAEGRVAGATGERAAMLTMRDGVCTKVTIVDGRCLTGAGEIIVPATMAATLNLRHGDTVSIEPGRYVNEDFSSDGDLLPVTITGVYTVTDPADAYWAGRDTTGAVFASLETLTLTGFGTASQVIDLIATPAAFDDLDALRTAVTDEQALGEQNNYAVDSGLIELADQIDASRSVLRDGVHVAGLPLVALAWFVLYLAVTSGAQRRRGELGLAALRGVPGGLRWLLGSAEVVLPALIGAPLGLLAAQQALSPLVPATITGEVLIYAVIAVGGAIGVCVLGQRRVTSAPVASLLRRSSSWRGRGSTALARAGELLTVLLAAGAAYQLRNGEPSGLALLTPAFIAVAVGVLVARLVALLAGRWGRSALRRGALARAIFTLSLARRPGPAQVTVLLIVCATMVGFGVAASAAAADARTERARVELGAARVLTVRELPADKLLAAVRAADPSGRYAMAAATLPDAESHVVAVDSQRLAAVAHWPLADPITVAEASTLLQGAGVPVLATQTPHTSVHAGGSDITVTRAALLPLLPRLGATGALADLPAVLRSGGTSLRTPEVWLAADAPASVVTALTANGLAITGDRSIGDVIAQSGGHGPDLALRFFLLSGIGAVLLGIAGVVVLAIGSWDDQVATMRALRHQGVARRTVRGQAVGGALLQVVVAGVAGAGTAALAWWLSRRVVPLFADGAAAHYPATWPSPLDVAPTLIVAVIVLAGTATATALALWRTVERSTR